MNTEAADVSIAIRDARRNLGLTLSEAADGICSLSYLSLIETGHRIPSVKIVRKLVSRLKIDGYYDTMEQRALINHDRVVLDLRMGKLESAARRLASADFSPIAECLRGELAEKQGDFALAIEKLNPLFYDAELSAEVRFRAARALVRVLRDEGQLNTAIEIGERALSELAKKLEPGDDGVYELRGTLATVYMIHGEYSRAEMLTNLNVDDLNISPWARAMSYWAKADLYDSQGRVVEAEQAAAKALLIAETQDRPVSVATIRGLHSWLELRKGGANLGTVIRDVLGCIEIFEEYDRPAGILSNLDTLALAYAMNGDKQLALGALDRADKLIESANLQVTASFYATAANTLTMLEEPDRAKQYLLNARRELESMGANRAAAVIWGKLAAVYEELGDATSALSALKAATELAGLSISQQQFSN